MNDTDKVTLILLLIFFLILTVVFYLILHALNMAQFQQLIVLLLSGFIQLYAGKFLFDRTTWECFVNVKGILALIPTMMDLKGNIEISLASRISTLANTTEVMKDSKHTLELLKQNVILIQCQVVIVSLFSIFITVLYVSFVEEKMDVQKVLLLAAIALSTGTVTCSLLGSSKLIVQILFISLI